ncbi:MAG: hypothetical protein AAFX03_05565 [Pseudomonadota bacterium]
MLRLISILLLLAGLAAAAVGVALVMEPATPSTRIEEEVSLPNEPTAAVPPAASSIDGALESADEEPVMRIETARSAAPGQLTTAPIAYEAPEAAIFGKPFDVTLSINATGAASAAADLPGRDPITEGEAEVGRQVRAVISGGAFEVEARSPDTQALSSDNPNVWRWRARALEAGEHELTLEIFAITELGALPIRTYRGIVTVQVSRVREAVVFAQEVNPIFMVLGGIGSALAGLLGAVRFFRGA